MYPDVKFIPRAVGVRALTPEGYDAAWDGILPAAKDLAKQGVDAIMVIGTSLTFYRGYEAHQQLLRTASQGNRPAGLDHERGGGATACRASAPRSIAVATAYADEVNDRLADFLRKAGFEVLALEGLRPVRLRRARQEEREGHHRAERQGDRRGRESADAVLISCGGLLTLDCAEPIEQQPRHPGGHQHAIGVLEGDAACGRQRSRRRPRPDAGEIAAVRLTRL